jgi:large subunit GTPase 1
VRARAYTHTWKLQTEGVVLTPFERNLELWRQLWRVVERSDLVVQIVDARHPLLFRALDLEAYAAELKKRCVMLINKADTITAHQRRLWAHYFAQIHV